MENLQKWYNYIINNLENNHYIIVDYRNKHRIYKYSDNEYSLESYFEGSWEIGDGGWYPSRKLTKEEMFEELKHKSVKLEIFENHKKYFLLTYEQQTRLIELLKNIRDYSDILKILMNNGKEVDILWKK